jgi:uncharacterized membrane protein YcaP (DUF421 family)
MLREHGIDSVSKVKEAHIEGSGKLSVIPLEKDQHIDDENERRRVV